MEGFDKLSSIHPLGKTACTETSNSSLATKESREGSERNDDAKHSEMIQILENAASQEWAEQVSKADPRFAPLLPRGTGTLLERVDRLLSEPDSLADISEIPALVGSIQRIEQEIVQLKSQSLEASLSGFLRLVSRTEGKRLNALLRRFGWSGQEPITLEECGRELGLTRERIRQIQDGAIRRIPRHPVLMPRLDEAIVVLEQRAPMTINDAAGALLEQGISDSKFHPKGVLEAARLLGRETGLSICAIRGGHLLTKEPNSELLREVPKTARRLAGQSGVTSVFQVGETLRDAGVDVEEAEIKPMLGGDTFDFLNDDWLWASDVKDGRNRLCNVTRRILSVASPQNVVSIRDGVRRHYRWRATSNERYKTLTVPPLTVLEAFYSAHPAFRVDDHMVSSAETLDYRRELGEADRLFVEIFRSSPSGLLDRDSLAASCIARGMNESTFSVYTSYSPILEHVDINIWKLRGVRIDPMAVEAIRMSNHIKPRQKRVLQWGWGEHGVLWIAARVPKIAGSMVIGCPGPLRRFFNQEEFACLTKEGNRDCGRITFNDRGTSYGYGTFVRRYGVDEDDVLLAEFDLNSCTVILSVVDEDVLDREA